MTRLETRMYFFLLYSLSGIQKGIQAGHASLEYARIYGKTKLFQDFIKHDKTWILLNGGVSRSEDNFTKEYPYELNSIHTMFADRNIPCTYFCEPDLNDAMTSICFIADERVWNKEKYPIWDADENTITLQKWIKSIGGNKNFFMREIIKGRPLA